MASVVALKPAVALLMAIKVRLPKVNLAAALAAKLAAVNAVVPMVAASRVATVSPVVNRLRAVATKNKSLPALALKSVITSKLLLAEPRRESVSVL